MEEFPCTTNLTLVVSRLVVCMREGVERMVVRWAGVKSSTSFSITDVKKLLVVGERDERSEQQGS